MTRGILWYVIFSLIDRHHHIKGIGYNLRFQTCFIQLWDGLILLPGGIQYRISCIDHFHIMTVYQGHSHPGFEGWGLVGWL